MTRATHLSPADELRNELDAVRSVQVGLLAQRDRILAERDALAAIIARVEALLAATTFGRHPPQSIPVASLRRALRLRDTRKDTA